MPRAVRFVMVGGFLGAGKTTTLARLSRRYHAQGLKVALVTNDQAENLVDTNSLRKQQFPVAEVAGACFCCRFDELVDKVQQLDRQEHPDIILAEPVGSCTDLVATVVQPLKDLYGDRFRVAPYTVLFKPSHGRRILGEPADGGFSPKAAYIFHKQLEEADAILINRLDEMTPAAADELESLVARHFPGTPILRVSARSGHGFDDLAALLESSGNYGRKILEIDYDVYAAGEAELGWLNLNAVVAADEALALDELLVDVLDALRGSLAQAGAEVAHLKIIGLGEQSFGVANLVSSHSPVELSLASRDRVRQAELVVNARVAVDPDVLERQTRAALSAACAARGSTVEFGATRGLRPGRPTPTYRYQTAR